MAVKLNSRAFDHAKTLTDVSACAPIEHGPTWRHWKGSIH